MLITICRDRVLANVGELLQRAGQCRFQKLQVVAADLLTNGENGVDRNRADLLDMDNQRVSIRLWKADEHESAVRNDLNHERCL